MTTERRHCTSCGAVAHPDTNFCAACGASIADAPAPPPEPEPIPEDAEEQPADDKRRDKGSKGRRVVKGIGIGCAAIVGAFVLLVIVVSVCVPAPDEGETETPVPTEQVETKSETEQVGQVSEQQVDQETEQAETEQVKQADIDLVEIAAQAVLHAESLNRKAIDHERTLDGVMQMFARAERNYQLRIDDVEERIRRYPREAEQGKTQIERLERQFENESIVKRAQDELSKHEQLIAEYDEAQKAAARAVKAVEKAGLMDKLRERLPGF